MSETKSRVFLAACPQAQSPQWLQAVAQVDAVMRKHRLRTYFEQPELHVSICWWPAQVQEEVHAALPQLQAQWEGQMGALRVQVRRA